MKPQLDAHDYFIHRSAMQIGLILRSLRSRWRKYLDGMNCRSRKSGLGSPSCYPRFIMHRLSTRSILTYEVDRLVLSSFFVGYLVTQMPAAWFARKYGADITLIISVGIWSLATLFTPFAAHGPPLLLYVTRIVMGLGEGMSQVTIRKLHPLSDTESRLNCCR